MDIAEWLKQLGHGWFTEGFDTPDLREARELLDEDTNCMAEVHTQAGDHRRSCFDAFGGLTGALGNRQRGVLARPPAPQVPQKVWWTRSPGSGGAA